MSKPSGKKEQNRLSRQRDCENILTYLAENPPTAREALMAHFGLTLSMAKKRLKILCDERCLIKSVRVGSTTAWTLGYPEPLEKIPNRRPHRCVDRVTVDDSFKLNEMPANLQRMLGMPPEGFEPKGGRHIEERMPDIPISSHKYCAGAGSCAALDMA